MEFTSGIKIGGQCGFCGSWHTTSGICPEIKEIEYYPNGRIKRYVLRDRTRGALPQQKNVTPG